MTPADLARIGEALYGDKWRRPLARRLQVDPRLIRRISSGHRIVEAWLEKKVRAVEAEIRDVID